MNLLINQTLDLHRGIFLGLIMLVFSPTYAQFNTVGDAIIDNVTGLNCYLVTPDEPFASGAVWTTEPIDLRESFELYFSIFLGCKDVNGADGLVFVLNANNDNIGLPGLDLGFTGLIPTIGIEIDDFENVAKNDPPFDHMSIFRNGVNVHGSPQELAGPVPALAGELNIEDCNPHNLRVSWDTEIQTLEVYVDCDLRLSYTGDIVQEIFNNNPFVYYGFTGATGGESNFQGFCPEYIWQPTELRDTLICQGNTLQADAGEGIAYNWTPTLGVSNPTIRNPILSPEVSTTYTVEITLPCGITKMEEMTIEVPILVADAGEDVQICEGENIQLQGTGQGNAVWVPAVGLSNPNILTPEAAPEQTTTYNLTITDENGCTAEDEITVEVLPIPVIEMTPDTLVCEGDPVPLFATGGTSYQWTQPNLLNDATSSTPTATITGATVFEVEVTNEEGCTATDQTLIFIQRLPTIEAGNDQNLCYGDTLQLNATGGITYQWEDSPALSEVNVGDPLAFPLNTTSFTVIGTDDIGCRNFDEVLVSVLPLPSANAGVDTLICPGDSVNLFGSGGIEYSWSPELSLSDPNIVDPVAFPLESQTYLLEATDEQGCTGVDEITITILDGPTAEINESVEVCLGDSVALLAGGGIAYNWSPGEGLNDILSPNPIAFPIDTTTYIVEVADENGCTDTAATQVFVIPLPEAFAGEDQTICEGDTIQLLAAGGTSFNWQNSDALDRTDVSDPLAYPLSTSEFILTVANGTNCIDTDTIQINVNPLPDIEISEDTAVCINSSARLSVTGGVAFSWSPTIYLDQPNFSSPTATPPQSTRFTVEVKNEEGCIDTASVGVEVLALPELTVGPDAAACNGDTISLQADGEGRIQWSPTESLIAETGNSVLAFPTESTQYRVVITDEFTCQSEDSVFVEIFSLPELELNADTTLCQGDSIFLNASGAITYNWFPTDFLDNPQAAITLSKPEISTIYQLQGTDENGCSSTESISIQVNPRPIIEGDPLYQICPGQETVLSIESDIGDRIEWDAGDDNTNIIVAPIEDREYWVLAFNGLCPSDTFEILVDIFDDLPVANFTAQPFEGYPPLEVTMTNLSQNAVNYVWSFGDGNNAIDENPVHTYLFPGNFEPELIAINEFGCRDTFSLDSTIEVFDVAVYIPNAFTPNGDGRNDLFDLTIGAVASYELRIFDRWGKEIFFSFDTQSNWDGTSEGTPQPEGVYVYLIKAETYDAKPIVMRGSITLLR